MRLLLPRQKLQVRIVDAMFFNNVVVGEGKVFAFYKVFFIAVALSMHCYRAAFLRDRSLRGRRMILINEGGECPGNGFAFVSSYR